MLVRKCGLDAVKVVMPEEHMKLLTNIRKVSCKLSNGLINIEAYVESRNKKIVYGLFLLRDGFGMQIRERKEKKVKSEGARSMVSKATSRYLPQFI